MRLRLSANLPRLRSLAINAAMVTGKNNKKLAASLKENSLTVKRHFPMIFIILAGV
jgi:FixJ family two-component response regulator